MTQPFVLLAYEAANFMCSISLQTPEHLLAFKQSKMISYPTIPLIKLIKDAFFEAGIAPSSVRGIVTTVGPGSFTGLRNSLAVAKAFAMALPCPVIGVNSFAWVFHGKRLTGPQGILLDSQREEPFAALLDKDGCFTKKPDYLKAEDMVDYFEGHPVYDARLDGLPDSRDLARMAFDLDLLQKPEAFPIIPLYLRSADVCTPKKPY